MAHVMMMYGTTKYDQLITDQPKYRTKVIQSFNYALSTSGQSKLLNECLKFEN